MTLKKKIGTISHHPSIIRDLLSGKSKSEIRMKIRQLDERARKSAEDLEVLSFIRSYKEVSNNAYHADPNARIRLNKLCCIEDWDNHEVKEIIPKLQDMTYYNKCQGILARKPGQVHRKDWEWTMGTIAMKRFGKLNEDSTAIGVGAGKELILFYLAKHLRHLYATDLYNTKDWENFAPEDFPEDPSKYSPFPYNESALAALRMDGTRLEFPSDTFDIVFSFSSIEHFGGENYSGALKSLREMERVLKPGGIAIVATEYIINNKDPPDHTNQFYNERTIYSHLVDKLDRMKLVEPLDLTISQKTLDKGIIDAAKAVDWDTSRVDDDFKKANPYIVIKLGNILVTSIMLVFRK
ncbi:MAG TPA: methyltransferase domain-containing protein [Nitrososphaera sp.]|nr:methyltransferase domain-containing protein [Nitrososphaera sp.]